MAESVAKFERLMNLVAFLLASPEPVPFARIRKTIIGYNDVAREDAVEKRFDRDKKELREIVHHAALGPDGAFAKPDEIIDLADEPDHLELCAREQRFFRRAIIEDLDLSDHMRDAVNSLRIVLAANESVRTGQVITL